MKDTGGSAFPCPDLYEGDTCKVTRFAEGGMTLRDYFAAKAMQSQLIDAKGINRYNNYERMFVSDVIAKKSYTIADAMLAARGVK